MNRRIFFKYLFSSSSMSFLIFPFGFNKKPVIVRYQIIPKDKSQTYKSAEDLYSKYYTNTAYSFNRKNLQNGDILSLRYCLSSDKKKIEGEIVYRDRKALRKMTRLWIQSNRFFVKKTSSVKYVVINIV